MAQNWFEKEFYNAKGISTELAKVIFKHADFQCKNFEIYLFIPISKINVTKLFRNKVQFKTQLATRGNNALTIANIKVYV